MARRAATIGIVGTAAAILTAALATGGRAFAQSPGTTATGATTTAATLSPADLTGLPLRNVAWQALPPDILNVSAGPDGRIWFEVQRHSGFGNNSREAFLEAARRQLEAQFNQPHPQLAAMSPVLFEPGGRSWFFVAASRALVAYDGKEFITHGFGPTIFLLGRLPGHGWPIRNLCIDGVCFFPDTAGVHTFDGAKWGYQPIVTPSAELSQPHGEVRLIAEPDGHGLIAYIARSPPRVLRRWRHGAWSDLAPPPLFPTPKPAPPSVKMAGIADLWAVTSQGLWFYYPFYQQIRFQPFDAHSLDEPAAKLVRSLDDDNANIRERSTLALIDMGDAALPTVEKALAASPESPEAAARLKRVLNQLHANSAAAAEAAAHPKGPRESLPVPVTVGSYQVARVTLAHQQAAGGLLVAGDQVFDCGASLGPGMVYVDAADNTRLWLGPLFAAGRAQSTNLDASTGRFASNPAIFWRGGRLFDLATGNMPDELPDPGFGNLIAVSRQGQCFCRKGAALMVYTPGAPDDRSVLRAQRVYSIPAASKQFGFSVSSDGKVWAVDLQRNLTRFDGTQWKVMVALPTGPLHRLIAGAHGEMLAETQGGCILFLPDDGTRGAKTIQSANLRELIADHRDEVAEALSPAPVAARAWGQARGGPLEWNDSGSGIIADKQGNIWLLDPPMSNLKVRIEHEWSDATGPLKAEVKNSAGADCPGRVRAMVPVGDGSKILVRPMVDWDKTEAAMLAEVKDGAVHFTALPGTSHEGMAPMGLVDHNGAAWISDSLVIRGASLNKALCITETGIRHEIRNKGIPVMDDAGGNMWFRGEAPIPEDTFNLVRDGKIICPVQVKSFAFGAWLFSDRPGSLYAWTDLGLQHLVSPAGSPAAYAVASTSPILGLNGVVMARQFSSLGYIVAMTPTEEETGRMLNLWLIPLPGDGPKPTWSTK